MIGIKHYGAFVQIREFMGTQFLCHKSVIGAVPGRFVTNVWEEVRLNQIIAVEIYDFDERGRAKIKRVPDR